MPLRRSSYFKLLAIETSFDDTCIAIVDSNKCVLYERILTQKYYHAPFKGVVPSLTRSIHDSHLSMLMNDLSSFSGVTMVAATKGPGLVPALSSGYQLGKHLAAFLRVPFLDINHMVSLYKIFLGSSCIGHPAEKQHPFSLSHIDGEWWTHDACACEEPVAICDNGHHA